MKVYLVEKRPEVSPREEKLRRQLKLGAVKVEPVGIFSSMAKAKKVKGWVLISEMDLDHLYARGIGVCPHDHVEDNKEN